MVDSMWTIQLSKMSVESFQNRDVKVLFQFWSVFEELDQDERKAFLEFFTGSDRVPIGGLGKLKPKIQSSGPDSDRLPTGKQAYTPIL